MKLNFSVENSLEKCRQLWGKFSPKRVLWDEWNVSECFYNPNFHELKFMYTEKGLLPLIFNSKDNRHEFFGNGFVENRTFWIAEDEILEFIQNIPENTYLFDMNGEGVEKLLALHPELNFVHDDYRNFLDGTTHEFLYSISGVRRRNLLNQLRKLDNIQFFEQDFNAKLASHFFEWSQQRFDKDSDFHDKDYCDAWMKFCKLPWVKTLVAKIDDKLVGVYNFAIYNDVIYALNSGSDPDYPNLGKLSVMNFLKLKDNLNLKEVDFMAGINDWKSKFHLAREPYYSFRK